MATSKTTFASLPRTKRGAGIMLGPDPKGETFLYTNGKSVFIRNTEDASKCDTYTQHNKEVYVAKYSPSRFYIASGDSSGKVRIWDTTQAEHPLKAELQPLSGCIRDIAWTGDSQRISVGGDGREKFCHVFMWDSGTSVGDLMGHDKPVNSVDFRSNRPFRLATGSEDRSANLFEGPPFKLKKMLKDSKNFVNCARFSPDGTVLAICTQDGHIIFYDAVSGDLKFEAVHVKGAAHAGGIYSIAFSPDSKRIITASGDKSAKIFDTTSGDFLCEFSCGKTVEDMIVGCLWQAPNTIIVVSLAGFIYFLDFDSNNALTVRRVFRGHNKPITALTSFCHPADPSKLYYASGSSDARIYKLISECIWDAATADCWVASDMANAHSTGQIQSLAALPGSDSNVVRLVSIATDDTLRFIEFDPSSSSFVFSPSIVKLDSQPLSVSVSPDYIAVACLNHLVLLRENCQLVVKQAQGLNANFKCVALLPKGSGELAVGMSDNRLRVFVVENNGTTLTERQLEAADATHTGPINALAYSPDGRYLAAGDQQRRVRVYNVESGYKPEIRDEWCLSNASVTSVAWSPDSKRIAAGSIDASIAFYTIEPQSARINSVQVRGAHPLAPVTGLSWPRDDTLVSSGHDSTLRIWTPN